MKTAVAVITRFDSDIEGEYDYEIRIDVTSGDITSGADGYEASAKTMKEAMSAAEDLLNDYCGFDEEEIENGGIKQVLDTTNSYPEKLYRTLGSWGETAIGTRDAIETTIANLRVALDDFDGSIDDCDVFVSVDNAPGLYTIGNRRADGWKFRAIPEGAGFYKLIDEDVVNLD